MRVVAEIMFVVAERKHSLLKNESSSSIVDIWRPTENRLVLLSEQTNQKRINVFRFPDGRANNKPVMGIDMIFECYLAVAYIQEI